MDYITEEVIEKAKKALEADKWDDFFDAFGFKIYGDLDEEAEEIELESYTDGGGDMIITLDVTGDWKLEFQKYVEDFDIDNEVSLWWPEGRPGKGVPFDNIRDLYDDIKEWHDWLVDISKIIDGKNPLQDENGNRPTDEELGAVRKWAYFASNYPHDFVERIWEGWLAKHFREKFNEAKDMNDFYRQLDDENKELLASFALNYQS